MSTQTIFTQSPPLGPTITSPTASGTQATQTVENIFVMNPNAPQVSNNIDYGKMQRIFNPVTVRAINFKQHEMRARQQRIAKQNYYNNQLENARQRNIARAIYEAQLDLEFTKKENGYRHVKK